MTIIFICSTKTEDVHPFYKPRKPRLLLFDDNTKLIDGVRELFGEFLIQSFLQIMKVLIQGLHEHVKLLLAILCVRLRLRIV